MNLSNTKEGILSLWAKYKYQEFFQYGKDVLQFFFKQETRNNSLRIKSLETAKKLRIS